MPIRGKIAGAVLSVALIAGGCGSGSGQSIPGAAPGLVQALGAVKDSVYSRTYFEWSDLAEVRKLAGLPPSAQQALGAHINPRWNYVFGVGTNGLVSSEPVITSKTALDFYAADRAIGVGQPPNTAMRIDGPGVDASAVSRKLTALGATRESSGSRTFLAFGRERSVNINGPLFALGVLSQLDRVVATGHTVAAGSADAPVDALLGGGRSLASDPAYAAIAGCLGDVVVAAIGSAVKLSAGTTAEVVGVGVLKPSTATAPIKEVVCTADSSAGAAARQEARMRAALGPSGRIPFQAPSGSIIQSIAVNQTQSHGLTLARGAVILKPQVQAGFLYRVLSRGAIGFVLGSEPARPAP